MSGPLRVLVVRVVAVVLVLALAGVGVLALVQQTSDPGYCGSVREAKPTLARAARQGSVSAVRTSLPVLQDLASKAPDDLVADWQRLVNAFGALDAALTRADLPADADLADVQSLPSAQRRAVTAAATDLADPEVTAASQRIEQQARDVCHVDLGV